MWILGRFELPAAIILTLCIGLSGSSSFAAGPPNGLDVKVINTSASPVPVTLQGGPVIVSETIVPFQSSAVASFSEGSSGTGLFLDDPVPSDSLLIIEYVSCSMTLPVGQRGTGALVVEQVGHRLVFTPQGTYPTSPNPTDELAAAQLTRLYSTGTPGFNLDRTSTTGTGSAVCQISGRLVPRD